MAVDKLVDSTQLDADLASVADAIRTKGGTSAQLAFPADFVSAINAISGGGGGSTTEIDSDYITLKAAIVTVGTNTVSKADQVIPYLLGLANIPTTNYYYTWWGVVDNGGTFSLNNMAVCFDITTYPGATKFYRYRNGAISSVGAGSSYDAKLKSGDKYLIVTAIKKGAPTV